MVSLRVAKGWVARQLGELLFCDIWAVGIADEPVQTIARRGSVGLVRWLEPSGGDRYLADPFGVVAGQDLWILAEDYSYRGDRGTIAACAFSPTGARQGAWKTVLETGHHMSYPQVFEHDGRTYCLPESAASGGIVLYRSDSFPEHWVPVATLVPNFAGVDPTLCCIDGRWWLFCTNLDQGDCTHLNVFYADSLTGPYTSHAKNPVKIDIGGSRPAGSLFQLDGTWIRPAQNCAKTYGGSISLNRILRLTPTDFSEEAFAELLPDPNGPFPSGMHTLNGAGKMTLVDGKCRRFVPRIFVQRLTRKLRRLGRPQGSRPTKAS